MKSSKAKVVAASIGAGAAVALGVLGVAFGADPASTGNLSEPPEPTLGETSTESAAPTELETTLVTPPVTAELPPGYGIEVP